MWSRQETANVLFLVGVLLTTFAYYTFLVFNVNVLPVSTGITAVVIRSFGLLMLISAVLLCGVARTLDSRFIYLFLLFSFLYVARLSFSYEDSGHSSPWVLIASYVAYVFLPFILIISMRVTTEVYDRLLSWSLLSLAAFGILCVVFYYDRLGQGRLLSGEDGSVLNPLILSYVSSAGIGVAYYLMLIRRIPMAYVGVLTSLLMVPFLLGASRGAVLGLVVAAAFVSFARSKKNVGNLNVIPLALVGGGVVIFFGDSLGAVTERVTSIFSDIESGASSSSRIEIWRLSLEQFAVNPFVGSSHVVKGYGYYPHNMFLEMLISTGIFGFIAFFTFVVFVIKESYWLVRHAPEYGWLSVLFIQQLVRYSFSHSFYTAVFFFVFSALVIRMVSYLRQSDHVKNYEAPLSTEGPSNKVMM